MQITLHRPQSRVVDSVPIMDGREDEETACFLKPIPKKLFSNHPPAMRRGGLYQTENSQRANAQDMKLLSGRNRFISLHVMTSTAIRVTI